MVNQICVVGQGYVGLPLALHLSKHFRVIGFDVNKERISQLCNGYDRNEEYSEEILTSSWSPTFTNNKDAVCNSDFIIVTVPTPITDGNCPDLTPLESASRLIGDCLCYSECISKPIIVFESTVYPGVTEEVCIPIIEDASGYKCGKHFFVGYSPERVNPGDQINTIDKITKIVSGMNEETLDTIDQVYSSFTTTHRAPSIKVAEAAKVIENSQRDLNIAFVNELALIFDTLGIDTNDVLEAAGTKWNFLPFKPGLVGGHCISVDPYYLTHKAEVSGRLSQVILAGRHVNDSMAHHVVELITRGLNVQKKSVNGSIVAILGATFKEDCKDTRNSKIVDVVKELEELGATVVIHDPFFVEKKIPGYNGKKGTAWIDLYDKIDLVVYAVNHKKYSKLVLSELEHMMARNGSDKLVVVDLKNKFGKHENVIRL